MFKDKMFLGIFGIIFLFMLFLSPLVSAKFVCGVVDDAYDVSANWESVRIFYEGVEDYAYCDVSPSDNKYCCDMDEIESKSWKIGDEVFSEVLNLESGYFALPVSIVLTGEGYDIFPELDLTKAIDIFSPVKSVIFSNDSFLLIANFSSPYNYVELEKNDERDVLCLNCSFLNKSIELNFGFNELTLISSFNNNSFFENLDLWVVGSYDFERDFFCDDCSGGVKQGSVVNMSLNLNVSEDLRDVYFIEYVPAEWEILETDGEIREHGLDSNIIVWNFTGSQGSFNYKVQAPESGFFPNNYVFKSELGGSVLAEDDILVYEFVKIFSSSGGGGRSNKEKRKKFKEIDKNMPIVIKDYKKNIEKIVVIPKKELNAVEIALVDIDNPKDISNIIDSFGLDADFQVEDIDKVYIEFKVRRFFHWGNRYKGVKAYTIDKNLEGVDLEMYKEDEQYYYYKGYLNPGKKIVIAGEGAEEWSIFDFIMEILSNIFIKYSNQ